MLLQYVLFLNVGIIVCINILRLFFYIHRRFKSVDVSIILLGSFLSDDLWGPFHKAGVVKTPLKTETFVFFFFVNENNNMFRTIAIRGSITWNKWRHRGQDMTEEHFYCIGCINRSDGCFMQPNKLEKKKNNFKTDDIVIIVEPTDSGLHPVH